MPDYSAYMGELWLRRNWHEVEEFSFQWVAATGDGLIGHSPDLEELMARVNEMGYATQAVYAFVDHPVEIERGA